VCCSVLQRFALRLSVLQHRSSSKHILATLELQCVAVRCGVLQRVAVRCTALQCCTTPEQFSAYSDYM